MSGIADQIKPEHPRLLVESAISVGRKRSRCPWMWNPILDRAISEIGSEPYFPEDVDGWLYDILDRTKERILRNSVVAMVEGNLDCRRTAAEQVASIIQEWPWVEKYHQVTVGLHADLRTGVIMYTLAVYHDWFHDSLSPSEHTMIHDGFRRGLSLLEKDIENEAFYLTSYGNNWLAVMMGGFGTAAISAIDEIPEFGPVLELAVERCLRMRDRIGDDGGWEEGVGYWGGLIYLAKFYDNLRLATNGEINYIDDERFKNTCRFPVSFAMAPNGRADFGDSYFGADQLGAQLYALCASRFSDPELQWMFLEYRENRNREEQERHFVSEIRMSDEVYQFLAHDPDLEPKAPVGGAGFLYQNNNYGFAVFRNGWGRSDQSLTVAIKGGNNGANHHHLDLGQVIVSAHGHRYFVDLEYGTEYYDSDGREIPWIKNFHKTGFGHNLLLVGGKDQIDGAAARAEIGDFQTSETGDSCTIELTSAYGPSCRAARRSVLHLRPDAVVVIDEIILESPGPAVLRWHHSCEVRFIGDNSWILKTEGGTAACSVVAIGGAEVLQLREGAHLLSGARDRAHRLLPDERHAFVEAEMAPASIHRVATLCLFAEGAEKQRRRTAEIKVSATGGVDILMGYGDRVINLAGAAGQGGAEGLYGWTLSDGPGRAGVSVT